MEQGPKTLQEAVIYFSNPVNCREYLVARRWPNGVTCPTCGSTTVKFSEKHNRWQCGSHHSMRQFTVKTGTIFEDSPLGLDKWLCAMWEIINDKNGVSSYEISRKLDITQKSCWFMLHRLREAMQDEQTGGKLSGEVEVDETFIGAKARNMTRTLRPARFRDGVDRKERLSLQPSFSVVARFARKWLTGARRKTFKRLSARTSSRSLRSTAMR